MSAILVALILAAAICAIMWRRPDARAAAGGAWQAGKQQALTEFRQGYTFAQTRLRAGDPRAWSPRRWASWLLAGAYGTGTTMAAANRVRRRAWEGGRDSYRQWKAAQPIDAEVLDEQLEEQPDTSRACRDCGTTDDVSWWRGFTPAGWYCFTHGQARHQAAHTQPDPGDTPDTKEEPDMQTEAAGLTSYAAAHSELATELRARMSGIESLVASMRDVLAEHSDLIGDTAVIQDQLNQAAGLADDLAARALAVANN